MPKTPLRREHDRLRICIIRTCPVRAVLARRDRELVSWSDADSAGPEEGYREIAVEVWKVWRCYGAEVGT